MAAGLSQRQIYSRVRTRLQRLQQRLSEKGVPTVLKANVLTGRTPDSLQAFTVTYRVGNASNGETFGFVYYRVTTYAVVSQVQHETEAQFLADLGIL
jgi:hypothetical protein